MPTTQLSRPSNKIVTASAPNRITVDGDTFRKAVAEYPEDQQAPVIWLYELAMAGDWSWKKLAAETAIAHGPLLKLFTGRYEAQIDNLVKRINDYRALYESRAHIRDLPFVKTSTAKSIFNLCDFARTNQTIGFLFGDSQIGKTASLTEYARLHNHGTTKLIRMPASGGVQLMMQEIAAACHISPRSNFHRLRERVLDAIDHRNLVIIDELHQTVLSYQKGSAIKCLEVIREIHDRTGCGMVLCATNAFSVALQQGELSKMLEQFTRRGVARVNLHSTPPLADVHAIAAEFGLDKPSGEAAELVRTISRDHGLGKLIKIIQSANKLASNKKQPLNWTHFTLTHQTLKNLETPTA